MNCEYNNKCPIYEKMTGNERLSCYKYSECRMWKFYHQIDIDELKNWRWDYLDDIIEE